MVLASVDHTEAAIGMTIAAVAIGVSDNRVRPCLMHVATPEQHPLLILLGVFGLGRPHRVCQTSHLRFVTAHRLHHHRS